MGGSIVVHLAEHGADQADDRSAIRKIPTNRFGSMMPACCSRTDCASGWAKVLRTSVATRQATFATRPASRLLMISASSHDIGRSVSALEMP